MKNDEIKIKNRQASSLSEFVKKPLPNEEEVAAFEKYAADEAKETEIKDSLAKIYQDDQGNKIDIKTLTVKKGRGFFFNLFSFIIVLFVLAGGIYAAYNYLFLKINAPKQPVSLEFSSKAQVANGEEFYYDLNYKNEDKVSINNIEIKADYPENFIFLSSDPAPAKNNNHWEIPSLASHRSDTIRIKGKLVGDVDAKSVILADMTYKPDNFSSEFKKSASFETKINDLGLDISFINSTSALIKEDNEIAVKFKAHEQNFMNNFRLRLDFPEEVEIIKPAKDAATTTPAGALIKMDGQSDWIISDLGKKENELKIKFRIKEKKQPEAAIKFKFEAPMNAAGQKPEYYSFYEKELVYEVIKSDLNLGLIINGSPLDQASDFGQTLNYSISYANKGESDMKDVIIMAVLESDFLDWPSLDDKNNGQISGNSISWSKDEIKGLALIKNQAEGAIDFSIKLKSKGFPDIGKSFQVKSYVKYSVAGKNLPEESQSNIIINKINSDLSLKEELRYFSEDNLAVGSGPLPPKVGQTTSLKVYWTLNNNLHELSDLKVTLNLAPNIGWDGKSRASVGNLYYDNSLNQIVWQIGRLPASVYKADSEFNVAVTPGSNDRNTLMIILPGTKISAMDTETGARIDKTLKVKTSKLEDDKMAAGDGVIE